MKHIFSTFKLLIFVGALISTTSCVDFMSTETNRLMLTDDNLINSPNDTAYSVVGILAKVQKLSDKYVLLGELRADLVDVSNKSEVDLRELSSFNVNPATNEFAKVNDFYSVINNCNYFIQRVDTNILSGRTDKPFIRELVAVKTIRAWTYLQLVHNFGKAFYFTKPLLTVADTKQTYPELSPIQMVDTLLADLNSMNLFVNVDLPLYFGKGRGQKMFISPRFLLGDLYLWKASFTHSVADYEMAATSYANLLKDENYLVTDASTINWYNDSFKSTIGNWGEIFTSPSSSKDIISFFDLATTSIDGPTSNLFNLCYDYKIVSSAPMNKLFADQSYCFRDVATASSKYIKGDLRATAAIMRFSTIQDYSVSTSSIEPRIAKYINFLSPTVFLYRSPLLYLRYAEAVNRAGKPGLAFAVLKYGLSPATLASPLFIPANELKELKEYFTIFTDTKFSSNIGIHSRGSGNSTFNANYVITDFTSTDFVKAKMDSIDFVENAICDELALETGFEGNRFQDLMRISNHKGNPSFLALKVAAKHVSDSTNFRIKLTDTKNWYLPIRE